MKFMAMDLIHGLRFNHHTRFNGLNKRGLGLSLNKHLLIIRLPNSWILKLMARTLLLAIVIVSFPSIGSILEGLSLNFLGPNSDFGSINLETLPLLFRDLTNEGLLKMGDRALIISHGGDDDPIYDSHILSDYEMDLISYSDEDRQSSIVDETFDFVFTHDLLKVPKFVDRTLKVGGVAAFHLGGDSLPAFDVPPNYAMAYLRRLDSTVVALLKTGQAETNSPGKRKLLSVSPEEKKAALKKLEDVLLEPPRAASGKSRTYRKRTRYLPDLMGDSLEHYPRRVFIDVGLPEKDGSAGGAGWFREHYPTRNKDFEMYKIETVAEEPSGKAAAPQMGMSDWLKRNVREEEYVVMKAEAEVVEEVVENRVLGLVDELFLECKHQGLSKRSKSSRRAYWECLALYGRLRDEGVAVHQWWG